jgi:hypothetical protein
VKLTPRAPRVGNLELNIDPAVHEWYSTIRRALLWSHLDRIVGRDSPKLWAALPSDVFGTSNGSWSIILKVVHCFRRVALAIAS